MKDNSNKSQKKAERAHARRQRVFDFLMRIVRPVARRKFNLTYETLEGIEGPYLVLSNHNTDWDCIFVGLASSKQLYFVATEKLARMGFGGWLVNLLFAPILHYKGKQGMNTIKAIFKHMKQGHNVAMFPEGNRSFNGVTCPIPPATGKMARTCGGTLVTYRWNGGYFSSPRWGDGARRGKIEGHIVGVYTHEQLMQMSDDEIKAAIESDLYVDAYKDQAELRIPYVGKDRAVGLESMLFMCPKCGRIGSLKSMGDRLFCTSTDDAQDCDFSAKYSEFGYLEYADRSSTVSEHSLSELDHVQHATIKELYEKVLQDISSHRDRPLFSDVVFRETIDAQHRLVERISTRLSAFADRLEIGDAVVPFDKIEGLAINQRNLLIVHTMDSDVHYECDGPSSFSALKYLYLCRAAKGSVNGVL